MSYFFTMLRFRVSLSFRYRCFSNSNKLSRGKKNQIHQEFSSFNEISYVRGPDCGGRCGCRKAGMQCSSVCGACHGICTNGAPLEEEEFELDREVEESNEI
ncbi:hypothetical protein AVEN_163999-1 [Araneus ventricosus]|uniref:Tesmin/TSO1-like CXC domain-containing protein n=1 Tax=Araneus ventricosus TaxID=182803 RepID=A0A4Y2D821_ARAVE|nr:hypothetical protein AVEN_163999-1 [Araneus ventricosus]